MSVITTMRRQWAIYWKQSGKDNFGAIQHDEAVAVKCRWDDNTERMLNESGEEFISRSFVYVDRDMQPGDFLHPSDATNSQTAAQALQQFVDAGGNVSDPRQNSRAYVVQTMQRNPNFKATETLITAIL